MKCIALSFLFLIFLKKGNHKDEELQLIFLSCAGGIFFGRLCQDSRGLIIFFRFFVVFSPGHWEPDETEAVLPLRNNRKDTHTHLHYLPDDSLAKDTQTKQKRTELLKPSPSPPFSSNQNSFSVIALPRFPASEDCFLGSNWSHEKGWMGRLILARQQPSALRVRRAIGCSSSAVCCQNWVTGERRQVARRQLELVRFKLAPDTVKSQILEVM